jgi:hypothetical protein
MLDPVTNPFQDLEALRLELMIKEASWIGPVNRRRILAWIY